MPLRKICIFKIVCVWLIDILELNFSTYASNLFLNLGAVGLLPASFLCESNSLRVFCCFISPLLCSSGRLTLADPYPPYHPAFKNFPRLERHLLSQRLEGKGRRSREIGPPKTKSRGCSSVAKSSICMHKTLVLFPA